MLCRNNIKYNPKKLETTFLHRQINNQKSKSKSNLKHQSNSSHEEVYSGKVHQSLTKLDINCNYETNMNHTIIQDENSALDKLKYNNDIPHRPQRNRLERNQYRSRIYETANPSLYRNLKNKPFDNRDKTRYNSLRKMHEEYLDPVAKALHMEENQNRNIIFEPLIKDKFPSKNIEDNIISRKTHSEKPTNFRPLSFTKKLDESIVGKERSIARPTAFYPSECGLPGRKEYDFTFLT